MNTLEIYKLLPRTKGCTGCAPGNCLAFAVGLIRGDALVEECPELSAERREEIVSRIGSTRDWREELSSSLFEEISRIDLAERADRLGLTPEGGDRFRLCFLGESYGIEKDGIKPVPAHWDRILIFRYVLNDGRAPVSGRLVAFRDLKAGSVKAAGFRKEVEAPLASLFNADPGRILKLLTDMGAEPVTGQPSRHALSLSLLPRIPFLILLWEGEEEIPADCRILLDETATDYLDVESLIFLGERFVSRIEPGD